MSGTLILILSLVLLIAGILLLLRGVRSKKYALSGLGALLVIGSIAVLYIFR